MPLGLPYALDTLRRAWRTPGVWVLLSVGALAGFGGLELSVLALGEAQSQAPGVVASTGHAFAVLVALWVLARTLGDDRSTALHVAADCLAPGRVGRLAGRWGGAVLAGLLSGVLLVSVLVLLAAVRPEGGLLSLYITIFEVVLLAAAWGLLFAVAWPQGPVVLLGLVAWFLGYLPWGTPALVDGRLGRGLGALLPGPRAAWTMTEHLPVTALAVGGLVCLALAWGGRPTART